MPAPLMWPWHARLVPVKSEQFDAICDESAQKHR
jgi:hypothetical protein